MTLLKYPPTRTVTASLKSTSGVLGKSAVRLEPRRSEIFHKAWQQTEGNSEATVVMIRVWGFYGV